MPDRKLAHDWHGGVVPDNVVFDDTNLIDTSYSFRRFRSRATDALRLGRGAAIYANSGFDLGPDARVEIGDFAMINGAEIVCDESILIGDYALISWNVLLMDNCRAPRSTAQRRAYVDAILRSNSRAIEFRMQPKPIVIGANVWRDYRSHAAAARELAADQFGADKVLTRMLDDIFSSGAGKSA